MTAFCRNKKFLRESSFLAPYRVVLSAGVATFNTTKSISSARETTTSLKLEAEQKWQSMPTDQRYSRQIVDHPSGSKWPT